MGMSTAALSAVRVKDVYRANKMEIAVPTSLHDWSVFTVNVNDPPVLRFVKQNCPSLLGTK